jgi:hypothetical protein
MSGPLVPFDYANANGGNVTLDTVMQLPSVVNGKVTVRDVMDINGQVLCYVYDQLYTA